MALPLISVGAIALSLSIAVPLGLLAGSRHGRATDTVITRVLEVFQALPSFVLVVFLLGLLQTADLHVGPWEVDTSARVALCLAIAFIPYFARDRGRRRPSRCSSTTSTACAASA